MSWRIVRCQRVDAAWPRRHRLGVGYRDEKQAARLRDDALEESAREFAEQVAEAEAEAEEELRRAEREPALRSALAVLTRPAPPFVRPEPARPTRTWVKAITIACGGALLAIGVVFVVVGGW